MTCTVIGAQYNLPDTGNGGAYTKHQFRQPVTLHPGDILDVRHPGSCDGCGGTGEFTDYARRRMSGEIHGP